MLYLALLVCVAITLGLLGLLLSIIREQQRPKPIALKPYSSKRSPTARQRSSAPVLAKGSVSDRTRPRAQAQPKRRKPTRAYPQLEKLLHGDRAAADRLIQNLLDSYPDKPEQWCYEKALFDLNRDRH
ncbi:MULTISPECIES: hypothetical protein [unclassified Leptolyngbya]|uniref:hypothetical protein n=1 Tax=unclassified Leptolyngbya TaxID=2650499 RepID=UPI0016855D5D|nr:MULTISPECIES: hypothetical protein [unclassified Leptolyngbya]MBD1910901.1 hypothetical protein [Leptolyngbya sp. FACHB-8]MBD2153704.1 hypothetical protein [Leptolyngbya sp. FACHB-16]